MTGVAAKVHGILWIGVAIDHALAGVDRRPALGVDDRHLTRVAAGIVVGDLLDDLGGTQALLEQRHGFGSVRAVG